MRKNIRDLTTGLRALAAVATHKSRLAGPRTVALILSRSCNSQCIMCWYHSPLNPPAPEPEIPFMDGALARRVIGECRAMGTYRIVMGGHGEPTLHPEYDDLIDLVDDLGMEAYVITNGLDLDPERPRRWSRRRAHVRVSLHAGDPETWSKIHPNRDPADFEAAENHIRTIAGGPKATVSTMHVLQRDNLGSLRATVDQASRLGVASILYMPVRAEGCRSPVLVDAGQEEALREELHECARESERLGIRTNLRDLLRTWSFTIDGVPRTRELYSSIPCVIGYVYLEVDIDGTVRPCEESKRILGRAGNDSLRSLWRSDEYDEFRRLGRELPKGGGPVPGCQCTECTMAPFNVDIARVLRLGRGHVGEG